jgi:mannan endo-1,4-beta-mannosidase
MRDNAANVFASDPLHKTMFSIHMYGVFDTAAKVRDYLQHFVTARLPLVIGEFGHFHTDGDPDEDAIMFFANRFGIGYMGWAWSGNCCGGEYLDMVTDFDPAQMTWWGRRIFNGANGIRSTSLEASIYSGERNPRVVSVRRLDPNPTGLQSVRFRILFSEAVTGVNLTAPNDFRLVTTGVTGAAITAVSGAGTSYTVRVNTGTGNGTVRLYVLDNDTIIDARKNTLGGPGRGYGNYTSGETYTITR